MNVFGSFTFGSLVKTFLPGAVWLLALVLIYGDLVVLGTGLPPLRDITPSDTQEQVASGFILSILLGLLSTIIVFMGINDQLVRKPVRAAEPALFGLYDGLREELRRLFWQRAGCADGTLQAAFDAQADPELLILPGIGVDVLSYVREQYWFHLEFQTNLLVAVAVSLPALVFWTASSHQPGHGPGPRLVLELLTMGALCRLLLVAARRNYARHIAKMSTLMAAVLAAERKPGSPSGAHGPSSVVGLSQSS